MQVHKQLDIMTLEECRKVKMACECHKHVHASASLSKLSVQKDYVRQTRHTNL